ncbi:hypothetical protein VNO77_03455 [Canavalia gladiata]|uniref:Uncharacterized protein n=1 Tax=Canavalia gladiata TaxID=3824 RepID=A0AAN9RC92_CANGL
MGKSGTRRSKAGPGTCKRVHQPPGQVSGLGFLLAIKVRTCDERGIGATQDIQVGYDRGLFPEVSRGDYGSL